MITNNAPGRTITIDGKTFLYFGGTAYLGLPLHDGFQQILINNLHRWATAYGSSLPSNVQ